MRSTQSDAQVAGVRLAQETARQCDEASFSTQRDAWVSLLLSMIAQQKPTEHVARQDALAALIQMYRTAATWPQQHREMGTSLPRLFTAMIPMVGEPKMQLTALEALFELVGDSPHSFRSHYKQLMTALPAVLLSSKPPASNAACALLGVLPGCMGTEYAVSWLLIVKSLTGTLQVTAWFKVLLRG